ncbi:MAG: pseudoazurin [Erythrobacter sp.]|uniref:pseudoazurin n=1 Tax=Erythrobacter sp. HL-111 TaxID=1798193 RepID=UPI0006DB8C77|nr:pseudoazurin [Erythrobacter sp. HL-111]KPP93878.1 MAG: Plastocyanin [Erythrobacteraceae bacterium HL-111]SDS35939.1 pseudoazurin [Erythrobacter sp. HL-111]
MKRTTLLSAVALASLVTLSACGGGNQEPAPAAEETEEAEAAPVAEETAPAEEEVAAVPEVEANGTVHEVEMLTRDPDGSGLQVFKPRLITAEVGDTVTFVPTDPTHQSSSIPEMMPAGVEGWEGEINEEVSYVLPTPGIYGYKCVPHYAAGMIGMIVVKGEGMTANLEDAKAASHPGLAGREFNEIFEQAESEGMFSS